MIRSRKAVIGNRSERSEKANAWLDLLNTKYKDYTDAAMERTEVVIGCNGLDVFCERRYDSTKVSIFRNDVMTCAKAAITHASKSTDRICILNFASPNNPGGGFLKGSLAQEEAICHVSALYPCLTQSKCEKYYSTDKKDDKLPYSYIYTESCPIMVNGKLYSVDILTMAAVNRASKFKNPDKTMEECQRSAFFIPADHKVDILLLGAWGCGVFGNDAKTVAENWKRLTALHNGFYKEIVHPVIDDSTYKVFRKVLL